jgi:hypothetical protein
VKASPLVVYLPDTRGVAISPYGKGNAKIGPNVYTYSRLPGKDQTCPGATAACEAVCYAKRVDGPVRQMWRGNSAETVPPIPDDCRLLRLHISGDFTTVSYINAWYERLAARPDVTAWAYTRSWRVPHLLPALNRLRGLDNVELFASMDEDSEAPPADWRVSWLEGDPRIGAARASYVCPEQTGAKPNCEACRYCFDGWQNDVTFLLHDGSASAPSLDDPPDSSPEVPHESVRWVGRWVCGFHDY